jgi:hypothetical protein
VLGSVSFIANRWTERIEDRVKIERAAVATAAKKSGSELIDKTIIQEAGPIWRSHKTRGAWWVAGEILGKIPLGRHALYRRLRRLKSAILHSVENKT